MSCVLWSTERKAADRDEARVSARRERFRRTARRVVPWDSLKPAIASLFASVFGEPELRELTRFFRTPSGQEFMAFQEKVRRLEATGATGASLKLGIVEAELQEMSFAGMRDVSHFMETPVGQHFQAEYFGPLFRRR